MDQSSYLFVFSHRSSSNINHLEIFTINQKYSPLLLDDPVWCFSHLRISLNNKHCLQATFNILFRNLLYHLLVHKFGYIRLKARLGGGCIKSWTHLGLSGIPNPLVQLEQECKMTQVSGLWVVLSTRAAWQDAGLQPWQKPLEAPSGFQQDFCCCCSRSAFSNEILFHWEVADWFSLKVSVKA